MKQVTRNYIWETASSAVHSLVVSEKGLQPSCLPVDKNMFILTDFGRFGKSKRLYTTQESKLSYLMTQLYYLNHCNTDLSDFYVFQNIEDAVCKYAGAKGIYIINEIEPYINHQAIPEWDFELNLGVDPYDYDSIINFVFNKYISFRTDCD